ncbi:MAG TPA: pyridoxamine 5'-phosphate oxidase family protein [Acidimicrobiales bacterium]|nr:pyridoxamine 5'-phosphate oxidase family protein [Acidimicrobiales bacterium]
MWVDRRGSEIIPLSECLRLLAVAAKEGAVGRLAVSCAQAPLVAPVNFTYRDRCVVVRLGEGTMASAVTGSLVAFETDAVDAPSGTAWSVLVRGLAADVDGPERLGAALMAPVPMVPSPGDRVIAIRADVVTGRRFRVGPPDPGHRELIPTEGIAAVQEG